MDKKKEWIINYIISKKNKISVIGEFSEDTSHLYIIRRWLRKYKHEFLLSNYEFIALIAEIYDYIRLYCPIKFNSVEFEKFVLSANFRIYKEV